MDETCSVDVFFLRKYKLTTKRDRLDKGDSKSTCRTESSQTWAAVNPWYWENGTLPASRFLSITIATIDFWKVFDEQYIRKRRGMWGGYPIFWMWMRKWGCRLHWKETVNAQLKGRRVKYHHIAVFTSKFRNILKNVGWRPYHTWNREKGETNKHNERACCASCWIFIY